MASQSHNQRVLHGPNRNAIPLEVPVCNRVGEGRTNRKSTDVEKNLELGIGREFTLNMTE